MKKGSLSLGSVSGIKMYVHWSFLLLIGYAAFTVWNAGGTLRDIASYIFLLLSVFFCVLLHELGHALTAKRYGIATTDITLLPIGGLARLTRIPEVPRQELWVALAGPAVNVAIAILLFGTAYIAGVYDAPVTMNESTGLTSSFILDLASVNLVLVIFNLIPAYPMDGGRVLRALLAMAMNRVKATRIAAGIGQVLALGFAAWGIYNGQPFIILIAIFVIFGARSEARAVEAAAASKGPTAMDAMRTSFPVLQITDTVTHAVQEVFAGSDRDFVVLDRDRFAGVVMRDALVTAVEQHLADAPVERIMQQNIVTVLAGDQLDHAVQLLQMSGQSLLPVLDNGKVLGIIDEETIRAMM